MPEEVLIVGAGLAGLAAAQALARHGLRVTLLESRARTGGRAGSFQDPASGQLVDACQHVSMGCCTNLAHFCQVAGISHLFAPQPVLYFVTPDGRVSPFRATGLPAPFHLASAFASAHYLTLADKARIAWGLARLWLTPPPGDPPFADWLAANGQTPETIDRFWAVVLVSALNEAPARVGFRYARKVFVDGFLTHPRGFVVEVPMAPLGELYGPALDGWMRRHGVRLLLNSSVRQFHVEHGRVVGAELRAGGVLRADWYVSAVPFGRVLGLLPEETAASPFFAPIARLEPSPITSVHLWYDRAVMTLPHAVLIGCTSQWAFSRGETAPAEHYVQVVVSASRELRALGHEEALRRVGDEMAALFPAAREARLVRSKVVTEQAATFSAVPGVDEFRPPQATPLPNFFLAGDWTRTGWPATMEGAAISGYRAAEELLKRLGRPARLVQPGLK